MLELKKIKAPELSVNCNSCGCYRNDMLTLSVGQVVNVKGRVYQITSQRLHINLCKDCREELRKLLEDSTEEADNHEG